MMPLKLNNNAGSLLNHERKTTVVVLNYHEVLEDARVLKQVRALVEAGYDVQVYCNQVGSSPQFEVREGFSIRRFKCFAPDNIDNTILQQLDFLLDSKASFETALNAFVSSAEKYRLLKRDVEIAFGPFDYGMLLKSYFATSAGVRRKQLIATYIKANLKLRIMGLFSPSAFKKYKLLRRLQRQDREVRRFYRQIFQASSIVLAANVMAQQLPENVSIVHAHDLFTLPAGVWLAKKVGAKLIYDAHEYEIARATKMQLSGNSIAMAIEDSSLKFVDKLITVSPQIADLYHSRHVLLQPVLVMNSPDSRRYICSDRSGDLKSIRQMCQLATDQPLLVFTGGVQGPHRGLDKVLEAMTSLPGYHLAILGQRMPRADAWLRKSARTLGVLGRVHLFAEVDADLVPQTIASADVAVCPIQDASLSYRFAMPNKLFEAAFADVPLCVSNLPGLTSVVSDLKNGEPMDQTDPDSIAKIIRHVYENRQNYKLSLDAKQLLNMKYTWDVQMRRMLAMYRELLDSPN
jgi:glycosyltransferase involved in cell wall biosynthesis